MCKTLFYPRILVKQVLPFTTSIPAKKAARFPALFNCWNFGMMIGLVVGRATCTTAISGYRSAFVAFHQRHARLHSQAIKRAAGVSASNGLATQLSSPKSAKHNVFATATKASVTSSTSSSTRCFGSKPGSGIEGHIVISNEQNSLRNLNIPEIEDTIRAIREILGYPTYDVALLLTNDKDVREMNYDMRGVDSSTDILSFPLVGEDEIEIPGVLPPPEFDVEDYYCLGDMMISVPYVQLVCESDRKDYEERLQKSNGNSSEAKQNDDDEEAYDDRGVSGAMSTEFDSETRIHMLLVHGMLHLVGYDHIEDDDYELMVSKEEEVLRLLQERKVSFLKYQNNQRLL